MLEYSLLSTPPKVPYLRVTGGEYIGYLELSTSGSGLCLNGLYPKKASPDGESTSFVVITDTAQVMFVPISSIDCIESYAVEFTGDLQDIYMADTLDVVLTPIPDINRTETVEILLDSYALPLVETVSCSFELIKPLEYESVESIEVVPTTDCAIIIEDSGIFT